MNPVLIGYFLKTPVLHPDWLKSEFVEEICSVSACIAQAPKDWINQWLHNEMWVYDTPELFLDFISSAEQSLYDVYAYKMLPVLVNQGKVEEFSFPKINPVPLDGTFISLGFDIVSRSSGNAFECSPLSCNHMAEHIQTNKYCLIENAKKALDAASKFEADGCEPGPYAIIEVLRRRKKALGWGN